MQANDSVPTQLTPERLLRAWTRRGADTLTACDQRVEMRKAAGVTQAQLAEALGVSQARVSKIEHGEIDDASR
jgi:DNA-binding transcriptional regulator YiaG